MSDRRGAGPLLLGVRHHGPGLGPGGAGRAGGGAARGRADRGAAGGATR